MDYCLDKTLKVKYALTQDDYIAFKPALEKALDTYEEQQQDDIAKVGKDMVTFCRLLVLDQVYNSGTTDSANAKSLITQSDFHVTRINGVFQKLEAPPPRRQRYLTIPRLKFWP